MSVLDERLLAGLTVLDVLVIGGGLVVLIGLLRWAMRPRKGPGQHMIDVVCGTCGWHGEVSRYARRCPRCNGYL